MGATPHTRVHGDEILINDRIAIGGHYHTVLSNSKERGESFITMQLSCTDTGTEETQFVELTVSADSIFYVIR